MYVRMYVCVSKRRVCRGQLGMGEHVTILPVYISIRIFLFIDFGRALVYVCVSCSFPKSGDIRSLC